MGLSISQLVTLTNKGLPDTANLPGSLSMPRSYYINSLLLQVVILLLFILYFIVSIFRVVKKIKNPRFQEVPEDEKK
jgi:hypothetical protein